MAHPMDTEVKAKIGIVIGGVCFEAHPTDKRLSRFRKFIETELQTALKSMFPLPHLIGSLMLEDPDWCNFVERIALDSDFIYEVEYDHSSHSFYIRVENNEDKIIGHWQVKQNRVMFRLRNAEVRRIFSDDEGSTPD